MLTMSFPRIDLDCQHFFVQFIITYPYTNLLAFRFVLLTKNIFINIIIKKIQGDTNEKNETI